MKAFPNYYYAPVFIKTSKIHFDFIDRHYLDELQKNACYASFILQQKGEPLYNKFNVIDQNFLQYYEKMPTVSLDSLGLQVIQPENTILTASDYENFYLNKPWALTDRYFYPFGYRHIGSSRHLLLYNCQLKGVGRNGLTHRGDFFHSWGGYPLSKNISAIINNIYIQQVTPCGALPIWASARFDEMSIPSEIQSPSLQIRDANAYRLAHFDLGASVNDKQSGQMIIDHLKNNYNLHTAMDVKQRGLYQYLSYFQNGISPRSSLIPENILFDSRAIDTDEYEIFLTNRPVVTLSFLVKDKKIIDSLKGMTLPDILKTMTENKFPVRCENLFRIKSSWIIFSTIVDQLYGSSDNHLEMNHQLFNDALMNSKEFGQEISAGLKVFLEDIPQTLTPVTKFKDFSEEMKNDIQHFHLISGKQTGFEGEGDIYQLTFSRNASASPLENFTDKMIRLYSTEKLPFYTPEEAMFNYDSLKKSVIQLINLSTMI